MPISATRLTLTVNETAAALGVHPATVRRLIRDGDLTAIRVRNRVLVTAHSLHTLTGAGHER